MLLSTLWFSILTQYILVVVLSTSCCNRSQTHKDPCKQCDQIGQNFATWANLKNIWPIFEGIFSAWQNFEPTLAN